MTRDERVEALAARVADGSAIDWPAANSPEEASGDPALVANLKAIAALAAVHRGPETGGGLGSVVGAWGPLTVIDPIGQGRFGTVYRAWDARLARQVALKLLNSDASATAADPGKAIDEARLLARVRHPNVLTVHGAECFDSRVGIWTELIDGRTLHDLAGERGPLPPDEVAAIGRDLASALGAVHDAGLLHRDVKAQNVMRESGGRIVLMDFGTVHDAAFFPAGAAALAGTPLYMAPELFVGGHPTIATDVYAVAVVLFWLLTGEYPVSGATFDDVKAAHAAWQRRRLRDCPVHIPEPLMRAIERGLAPDPAQRFASAREFADALTAVTDGAASADHARRMRSQRLRWLVGASLLSTAALGVWLLSRIGGPGDVPVLVCRDCVAQDASFAADGRTAVLGHFESGDLLVRDLATRRDRRLFAKAGTWSDSKDFAEMPVVSRDGRWVAFRWISSNPFREELRVMSNGRDSLSTVTSGLSVWPLDWRPDKGAVLATILRPDGWHLVWVAVPGGEISVLRSLSSARANPVVTARVAPDGRHIVYAARPDRPGAGQAQRSSGEETHLFVVDAKTGEQTQMVADAATNAGPVWTADGSRVLYTSNVARSFDLWSIAVGAGRSASPQLVKKGLGQNVAITLTSDGRYVYARFLDPVDLFMVSGAIDRGAGVSKSLTAAESIVGIDPRWSPDGERIAFFRKQPSGEKSLVVRSLRTQAEEVYDWPRLGATSPMWTRDSKAILVAASREKGQASIYRVDLASKVFDEVLPSASPGIRRSAVATLSPDDRAIYFGALEAADSAGRSNRVVAFDLVTLQQRELAPLPAYPSLVGGGYLGLAVSPDASTLAIFIVNSATHEGYVRLMGTDGGNARDLAGPFPAYAAFGKISWASDNTIWYAETPVDEANRGTWRIVRMPATGGAAVPVVSFIRGGNGPARFAPSPDGSRLAWYPDPKPGPEGPPSEVWRLDVRPGLKNAK